jgi:hypothetical protein
MQVLSSSCKSCHGPKEKGENVNENVVQQSIEGFFMCIILWDTATIRELAVLLIFLPQFFCQFY